jgi:acyl-CoA thioesterase
MSYYTRIGEHRYRPTEYAGGAWNPTEIHFSPLGGLLLHEIDLHHGDRGLSLGRVSFDILGFLGTADCEIRVETIRPGRTIELVEAVATIGDRVAVRARAWFLSEFDTSAVEGGAPPPLPAPETVAVSSLMVDRWTGGFVRSLEVRPVVAEVPGRATVWVSSPHPVVDGEPISDHASFISLVDTANGIAVRESPTEWAFPNVDLTIHLHRQPSGSWVGLDTSVTFGSAGQGITSTVLHDERGAVGFAHQMLTIRSL